MNHFSLNRIGILVCAFLHCGNAIAADEELLDLVAQKLGSVNDPQMSSYLDRSSVPDGSPPNTQNLKELSAFGLTFSGRANLDGGNIQKVNYWSDDSQLRPAAAKATFKAITSQLQRKYGPPKFAELPNYDDGFNVVTRALRWQVADEFILLYLQVHSPLANINLVRIKQVAWLAEVGADESELWEATVRHDAEQPPLIDEGQPPLANPKTAAMPSTTPPREPDVKPEDVDVAGEKTSPVSPAPERQTTIWPWLAGIVIVAVFSGFIWKRRA